MQHRFLRRISLCAALAALAVPLFASGEAETPTAYPARDITIIIPHSPGGGTDTTTRMLAGVLERYVDVSIVTQNRTGGGGAVGMNALANSNADGYILGVPTVEITMLPHMGRAPFTIEDFTPVAMITNIPAVVAVHAESRFETFEALIDYARDNPGVLRTGNSGIGAIWHFVALGIEMASGVEFTHVPFDGGAPAATALLGRHIDMVTIGQSEILPYHESGDFRALAVTSAERLPNYPDVPTLAELGIDLPPLGGWQSWALPAGADPNVVAALSELIDTAMADDEFRVYLRENGLSNDYMSPEETSAFWAIQNAFFQSLVDAFEM
ncbi:MAG: tripartite tricarboxylate transporter substrate binding protein [Spirochaetales bacterium]|nr:tripartite tricarboxylate transporter substrate binding protein [Spirochaetales bacterium]